jgi:magnesium chelatase subunit D
MWAMIRSSIPEVSPAWADALLAARLIARFGPIAETGPDFPRLHGVHLRARPGPVLDAWLSQLQELVAGAPFVRFSAAADAERLGGGLDLSATLEAGRPIFEPGILARADRGIAVFAMAERAEGIAASIIGEALDTGRCGDRPSRFLLVAIDEGSEASEGLCSRLADRMELRLDLSTISFREAQAAELAPVPEHPHATVAARIPEAILAAFAEISLSAGPGSMRLLLSLCRVARAVAGLEGAGEVTPDHAGAAIRLVLGAPLPSQQPQQREEQPPAPEENEPEAGEESPSQIDPSEITDMLVEAAKAMLPDMAEFFRQDRGRLRSGAAGKAGQNVDQGLRGKAVGHRQRPPASGARPDIIATLRTAAPFQRLRGRAPGGDIAIRKSDFRYKRRRQKTQSTTIFAVDASGSTALDRLGEAKGAVELLLADCYVRRDEVALIAFRGEQAELLLEPTRSLVRAKRSLGVLPGGGTTPLASGLFKTLQLAAAVRRKGQSPLVVILTDGSGNVALDGSTDREAAARDAEAVARQFAMLELPSVVIDISRREREASRRLADTMRADYCRLPKADAAAVSGIVAGYLRTAG